MIPSAGCYIWKLSPASRIRSAESTLFCETKRTHRPECFRIPYLLSQEMECEISPLFLPANLLSCSPAGVFSERICAMVYLGMVKLRLFIAPDLSSQVQGIKFIKQIDFWVICFSVVIIEYEIKIACLLCLVTVKVEEN
ncbi:hypothetical protein SLEP1_g52790 [Rubroshorea leprosula]|uniref:Uncharacterized protein n=1 Tax=Rubroshorea leprosula TaxID=152421 RepID=A0AAV5M7C8_9ROSI|nr:hypothetical protein SLEP1_g52790 [Rubroshorea leprosula]